MGIRDLLLMGFNVYSFLLIVRIFLSWLPHDSYHPLVLKLGQITDPYLDIFRKLPLNFGGLDLSPLVAFFVLGLIRDLVVQLLIF
jgi:YggT family protein